MSARLILYDTCNYRDYPVGGQVTSIKNFLRYLAETKPEHIQDVLLVGVSCDEKEIGRIKRIEVGGASFTFLAVTLASTDLSRVQKSLRLEYVKGLYRYRKLIGIRKEDCNYIHTPEAFGAVRFIRPGAVCYVFSHGTYLDMWKRVRFFKKVPIVRKIFQSFLIHVIRRSTAVFVLEEETLKDYSRYNRRVVHVGNSIVTHPYPGRVLGCGMTAADGVKPGNAMEAVCGKLPGYGAIPEDEMTPTCGIRKGCETEIHFIYAGRLSHVKHVGPMIEAVMGYSRPCTLTVLGDGEERSALEGIAAGSSRILFKGAVTPDQVQDAMKKADILVMNSIFEGIPMTILEAISLGLPVVTTDVGGIKEVLDYGTDSEMTDGTSESIRKAFDLILDHYNSYAQAAHMHSLQFDYRKVNNKVFAVINESLLWD